MRGCKPARKLAFECARACVCASVCEHERKRLACARGRNASAGVMMSTVGELHLGDAEGVRPLRHDAARGRPLWEPLGRHLKGANQAPTVGAGNAPHRRRPTGDSPRPAPSPPCRRRRPRRAARRRARTARRSPPRSRRRASSACAAAKHRWESCRRELGWQVALAALAATARRALAALRRGGSAGQRMVRMKFAP